MNERQYREHERGQVPDEASAKRIAKDRELYGTFAIAKRIGVSRESLARYIARLPMYSSTLQRFASYLRDVRP